MSESETDYLNTTNSEQTSAEGQLNTSSCMSKCYIRWKKKKKKYTCIPLVFLGIILLSLILALVCHVGRKDNINSNTDLKNASRHKGNNSEGYGVSNDLLINPKECNPSNCIMRKEIITVVHIPYESRTCEESSRQSCVSSSIKNSTCYYCNNTCFTKDDLIDMERIKCKECPYVEFECCLVAEILTNLTRSAAINLTNVTRLTANNLTNLIPSAGTILTNLTRSAATNLTNLNPSAKGNYSCYKVDIHKLYNKTVVQPLLECPFGWKGERCQERNTQEFTCKCYYTYKLNFPDQDTIPECNKKPKRKTERISKCFMSKKINGIQRKCLCTNEIVEEANNKDSSENYHT